MTTTSMPELAIAEELQAEEQRALDAIFGALKEHGHWPTLRELERRLPRGYDVGDALRGLGDGILVNCDPGFDDLVRIRDDILARMPGVDELFEPLLRALPLLKEIYYDSENEPQFTSEDLRNAGWSQEDVARVGALLRLGLFPHAGAGHTPEEGTWRMKLQPGAWKLAEIESVGDLVDFMQEQDEQVSMPLSADGGTEEAESEGSEFKASPHDQVAEPAGIEYLGSDGTTRPCVEALHLFLMRAEPVVEAVLVTNGQKHAFLLGMGTYRHVAIKSGFSSGYVGEGPRGLSTALLLLRAHDVPVYEVQVSAAMMERLAASALTRDDLLQLTDRNHATPGGGRKYIFDDDREEAGGWLWRDVPMVMPFGILDSRLHDLAIGFWKDPDGTVMKAFRRLEDVVRKRSGIDGEGATLFKRAFLNDDCPLRWRVGHQGEQVGRANLFIGAFSAFRNPRMHRERGTHADELLAEFLLINELYRLENAAVTVASGAKNRPDAEG